MLFALIAVLAAAATDAAPAAPATTPAAAAAASAKPVAKPDAGAGALVCHTEQVTGSMFPHKVCRRQSDDETARADQQKELRGIQHSMTLPQR